MLLMKSFLHACAAALICLVLAGCFGSSGVQKRYESAIQQGRFEAAAQEGAQLSAEQSDSQNRVLVNLENGLAQFWANKPAQSWDAFCKAQDFITDYEARASLSARDVGAKLGSFLTNDSVLPYRGFPSDKISLHTYQALNALAQGNLESAKVELRQGAERRKEAINAQSQWIDKKKSSSQGAGPSFSEVEAQLMKSYGSGDLTLYKDFANPFNILVEGMVFALGAEDQQERVHGLRLLQTLAEIQGWDKNIFGTSVLDGSEPLPPALIVIAERGMAPQRVSDQIYLPFVLKGRITGIHLAFPRLNAPVQPSWPLLLSTPAGDVPFRTLADVGGIHRFELSQLMPKIIWSQVALAVAKAVTEYNLSQNSVWLGLAANIYNAVITKADTRSWQSLPARYEMAIMAKPTSVKLKWNGRTEQCSIPGSKHALLLIRNVGDNDLRQMVIPLPEVP
jgi:uncharacterized protein